MAITSDLCMVIFMLLKSPPPPPPPSIFYLRGMHLFIYLIINYIILLSILCKIFKYNHFYIDSHSVPISDI